VTPIKHNLVALGSAAVLAVYSAGYVRTRAAAERFAAEDAERRQEHERRAQPMVISGSPTDADAQATGTPAPREPAKDAAAPVASHVPAAAPTTTAPVKHATHAARKTSERVDSTPVPRADVPAKAAEPTPPVSTPAPVAPPVAPTPEMTLKVTPPASADTTQAADKPLKDGVYSGWGTSRHGDIQATVAIKNGKITEAFISECLTQYSCSWVAALPPQVVARQSAEVDYVSGATQSTNAFYYAVIAALKKAK
jgi:uncharacterized protein with FMN-binding domain